MTGQYLLAFHLTLVSYCNGSVS